MKAVFALAILCSLPLAACAGWDEPENQPAPHVGEAVRNNIRVQLANPKPKPGPQTMDAERAAQALDRYVKGKTIVPEDMDKVDNQSGGGGGH